MDYFRPQSASSAVKIVDPSTQNDRYPKNGPKDSVQRQCRNVMIYGSCKFQDKGCTFYHPPSDPDTSQAEEALSALVNINAPVFVPKSSADTSSPTLANLTPSSPPPDVSYTYSENGTAEVADQMQGTHIYDDNYAAQFDQGYYAAQPVYTRAPLDYHLYSGPLPSAFSPASTDIHFMPSSASIRETLQTRSELIRSVNPSAVQLPEELQGYHSLSPLETVTVTTERRKFGNWYSTVYKAINSSDGGAYALRRIESYRMTQQSAFAPIEAWSKIRHPNIVSVCEAFTTRAFNDNSLVVAYTYHPNAQTLFDVHLKPKGTHTSHHQHQHWYAPGRSTARGPSRNAQSNGLPERTIWSYVVQIASAIRKVHEAGQAVRTIEPSKILVTGRNRIRIGSCGLVDVLMHEMNQDMAVLQQEDFIRFGGLILVLCCNNAAASAPMNLQKSFDLVERAYGADLKNLVAFLLGKASAQKLHQLFDLLSSRIATEMDDALDAVDRLEGELMSELENARLVRLMAKFGFINERPEFARDARWSETGDRYIIKLFRDYVFHQVDEYGHPVVSLSHVLTTLNKLDAGTDEKIMLVARDEQSCLVVSYKEIKTCMESAFSELAGSQQTKAKEVYRGGG